MNKLKVTTYYSTQLLLYPTFYYIPPSTISQLLLYPSFYYIPAPTISQLLLYPTFYYIPAPIISQLLLYPSFYYIPAPIISQLLLYPSFYYIPASQYLYITSIKTMSVLCVTLLFVSWFGKIMFWQSKTGVRRGVGLK